VSECFDIVTSGAIPAEPLGRHLASVLPGREVVVTQGVEEVPEPFPAVWVRVVGTADPDWPCMLQFYAFPGDSPLGRHPDLRLAEALAGWFGVRSLCDTHGLVPGLDPHDPYWFLAWADGGWHLADVSGTPLMGPYTDGTNTFPGDQKVRLKQRVGTPRD
jgi:hypothetical protein